MRLVLFILLFPLITHAQSYPLHIMEEGHIIIQVKLADSITGNFVLDTGAGANVLSASMFSKIEANTQKAGYFTGFRHDGDRLDGTAYTIPYLAIGDIQQLDPIVGVYPPLDDYGIDGLLSLKFFEDKPFTIDYINQKLEFLDPDESIKLRTTSKIILPLSIHQHTNILLDIFLPIYLNDTLEVLAEFDTGSGHETYIFNTNYIQDLGLDTTQVVQQNYTTQISNEERIDHIYQLKTVGIVGNKASLEKENINVIFREKLIYNALIGSGLFKDHRVTIDIPNRLFMIHD